MMDRNEAVEVITIAASGYADRSSVSLLEAVKTILEAAVTVYNTSPDSEVGTDVRVALAKSESEVKTQSK